MPEYYPMIPGLSTFSADPIQAIGHACLCDEQTNRAATITLERKLAEAEDGEPPGQVAETGTLTWPEVQSVDRGRRDLAGDSYMIRCLIASPTA